MTTLIITFALQILKLLYQYKIIKTDAQIKELERRLKAAVNQAEGDALDPVILRDQHKKNETDLEAKAKAAWGDEPDYTPVDTSVSIPLPVEDPASVAPFIVAPAEVEARAAFLVEVKNLLEDEKPFTLSVGKTTYTLTSKKITIAISQEGLHNLILKNRRGVEICSRQVKVKECSTWNNQGNGWNS